MKPHLPISLLTAVVASLFIQPVSALELPDNYEMVNVWTPSYINGYTNNSASDYCVFYFWTDDIEFSPSTYSGWTSSTPLFTGGNLIFTSIDTAAPNSVKFTGGSSRAFSEPATLTFDSLSNLTISSNAGNGGTLNLGSGGALYIQNVNDGVSSSDNADVVFSGNSGSFSDGGAICANGSSAKIEITHNGDICFSGNSAGYDGGAICSNGASINISDNENISFSVNSSSSYGGAIYSTGSLNIQNNGDISFSGNISYDNGGAIYSISAININGNNDISFTNNKSSSYYGGAIFTNSSLDISGNNDVIFSSNSSYHGGGAICANNSVNISNNGDVYFGSNLTQRTSNNVNNHYQGGAIYSGSNISILGNDSVVFEKNYERYSGRLRGIYQRSGNLNLSAGEGQHITIYDSVYSEGSSYSANFNADYEDSNGKIQKATGDIIFSGKYAAEHLAEVKGSTASSSAIRNSQTSEIYKRITLYGGTLQVVDGAKLNGHGLTIAADSNAKLLLRDASMEHSGYNFTFNNGTELELQGKNTLKASTLYFNSGSTLTTTVGQENLSTAVLSLGKTYVYTYDNFTINLASNDSIRSGSYKILSTSGSSYFKTASNWTAANVTVNGSGDAARIEFSDLVWENGTLYYKVGRNIWSNASGDCLWNETSDNWTMNGRSYTYVNNMDVYFTDEGAGEVKLAGQIAPATIEVNNSEGNDYTISAANKNSKLTGETTITKNGTGTLTITAANEHSGATVLNAGTLNLYNSTALGTTADGGTATVSTASGTTLGIGNKSHVVLAGDNSIKGTVNIESGSALYIQGKGYEAETSNVAGTLIFDGANSSTNNAGTLSGSGRVRVNNSTVQFAKLSNFSGDLSISGEDAQLKLGSNNLTVHKGCDLSFSSDNGGAMLSAARITVADGGNLEVEDLTLNIADVQYSRLTDSGAMLDLGTTYNTIVGGTINADFVTLNMGASYTANGAALSLNDRGELTLAVTKTATKKIDLYLDPTTTYAANAQVILFTDVATANFIADNSMGLKAGSGQIYTLNANNYFSSAWLNDDTTLVYDTNLGVVYLEGVNAIPEPTSATLSLLALTALAARRRRRA